MSKNTKKIIAAMVILTATVAAVAFLSKYTPYLENLELKNYDFMMAILRGPVDPPDDIVIVAIDEPSVLEFLETYDVTLPWPRSFHAELIHQLAQAGARAIVFDVLFQGNSQDPAEDEALVDAIRKSPVPVVVAAAIQVVDDERYTLIQQLVPIDEVTDAGAHLGFATLNPDRDGVLRSGRLFVGGMPTLTTQTLEVLGIPPDYSSLPYSSYEGDDPELLVNYVGGNRSIPTVSYYQAIDYETSLPRGIFQDKIVFVGFSMAVSDLSQGTERDHYASPFDGLAGTASMPGVEIHANLLNTILTGQYIRRLSTVSMWTMFLIPAIAISILVVRTDSFAWKTLTSLFLALVLGVAGVVLFVQGGTWVFMIQALVIMTSTFGFNVLYHYRLTEKERAHIRRALSGYVSKQVMNEILKNPDELELGGTQVEATVLFSDIVGFSKISERTTPRELAALLNNYFTQMGDLIMVRDGMINKYMGDAIMAIWNTPLPNPNHALLACQSALKMQEVIKGLAPLRMRIGINTGPMVAGNLGHRERMEYTVIGDSVNLASRLEGANKAYGTAILISESTEEIVRSQLLLRRVDLIRVVGKETPVAIFEVLADLDEDYPMELAEMVASFQDIIADYDSRNWKRALEDVTRHLERHPNDTVAAAYQKRCMRFLEEPPPHNWDGVFALESK